jgi:septum formation protein
MPDELALILAEAKALDVSARSPDAVVIGADQTLSLDDRVFHKPADMEVARRHLLSLSGRTHHLNSAFVLARNGEIVKRHVEIPRMTMRKLDPAFIGRHLARVGEKALTSVGAYQVEGEGIQLFDRIEGDYFAIVGLALLPLLACLRREGAIDG